MDYDNDANARTLAAREIVWNIFTPDWIELRRYPIVQLSSLCALSVGLHPPFSEPEWVGQIAIPYFEGQELTKASTQTTEEKIECGHRAELLREYLRRLQIATANLAPLGELQVAAAPSDAGRTLVWVTGFATWAESMGWRLPDEFPRGERM